MALETFQCENGHRFSLNPGDTPIEDLACPRSGADIVDEPEDEDDDDE